MAFGAEGPLPLVFPGIDLEVLRIMIVCQLRPSVRRMARLAVNRKTLRYVVRVRRPLKIGLMALVTTGIGQLVVPVHVTRLASGRKMSTRQHEGSGRVVEKHRLPIVHQMAGCARCRKRSCNVVWVCNIVEISSMTIDALFRQTCVLIVHVAFVAGD
jgi:hypothetical protein